MTSKHLPPRLHGDLVSSVGNRDHGRKIDTWTMRMSLPGGGIAFKVEFEVALHHTMELSVSTKNIDPSRYTPLRGGGIKELRRQAEEIARQEFDLVNQLTWSDWLEVQVKESEDDARAFRSGGSGILGVSYRSMRRGELPNGEAFTVADHSANLVRFPQSKSANQNSDNLSSKTTEDKNEDLSIIEHLERYDNRDPHTQFTYLPDTEENRKGLDAIIVALDSLTQRLQTFLSPVEIQSTLSKISQQGVMLLENSSTPDASISKPKGMSR